MTVYYSKDIIIHENDMSNEMTEEVTIHSEMAYLLIKDINYVAENISEHMKKEYDGNWITVLGNNCALNLQMEPG